MSGTAAGRHEAPLRPAVADAMGFAADLVGQLVVPTFALDADRRVILWNAACERLTGMPAERVLGTRDHWRAFYDVERPCLADLLVEGRQDEIDANYPIHHRVPEADPGAHTENWCVMPLRGTRLYLAIDAGPIRDADGRLVAVVETLRDMTVRQNAEEGMRLYANVFEHSGEAILVTDRENRIVSLNRTFTRLTGYALDEIRGRNPNILASGNTPPDTYQAMWKSVQEQGFWQGELWDRCKDGNEYPRWAAISAIRDDSGVLTHYIASFTDMTEHKAAADRIEYLAHHDALTGLCNRFCLEGRLAQSLFEAKRESRSLAVMFIDLDRF
ncbi:MAG: PAS domain S-box protein, partial [Rhodocyclaceae bacterium]|nr:PAS domain S-box protein [Rhodocyclaceae bacterium]